jgi:transposase
MIRELSRQATLLKRELHTLIAAYRPELLAEVGCGTITSAILIGQTAGAERFATDAQFARMAGVAPIPASSGKRDDQRCHLGALRALTVTLRTGSAEPRAEAGLRKRAEMSSATRPPSGQSG